MSKSMLKFGAALTAVLAFAACAADSKPGPGTSGNQLPSASSSSSSSESASAAASNAPAVLNVTAADPAPNTSIYDTAGVISLPAGPVAITFLNSGTEAHDLTIVRIKDGSFSAYSAAVNAASSTLASLADVVATAPSTSPNDSTTLTADLTAGTYALVSLSMASDGKTFAAHGMLRELTILAN